MKTLEQIKLSLHFELKTSGIDGGWGIIKLFPLQRIPMVVIFSWGGGWDHVSASCHNRCCTWDEMCQVKDIFFNEDECVVQYHPTKVEYVNNHPYVLHLWRPQNEIIPMPPIYMV